MSLKRALQTMKGLGLSEREARIYLFLSKKGPLGENELAFALNVTKYRLCQSLKNLKNKQMIKISHKKSVEYSAITLEKVLNESLKKSIQQANALQAKKDELLDSWDEITRDFFK